MTWGLFTSNPATSFDKTETDAKALEITGIFRKHFGKNSVDTTWQTDALCSQTDPEVFFPENNTLAKDARRVCSICPVQSQCLGFALKNDERYGVWGGSLEKERKNYFEEQQEEPLKKVAVGG